MIHAAMHWPEVDDPALWPLAVTHAAWLYNHTPNRESGIAPIEVFTQTKSDCSAIRNAKVWGSPCYVLEPRLTQAGGKIPRWQPRSRRAQYVGVSPDHADNIALVRNLRTGYISPQYHIIFDEWFETTQCMPLMLSRLLTGSAGVSITDLRQSLKKVLILLCWQINGSPQKNVLKTNA